MRNISQVGFAFVEPKPGQSVTANDLRDFLKARIANYKVPKSFEILQEIPKLPNSKLDKMTLKAMTQRLTVGPAS